MSRKSIDVTGKTIEEAKSNALAQLGLTEDEVSIEVLERGKQGLFGLFGASPAKIRVSYGLEEEPNPRPAKAGKKPAPMPTPAPVKEPVRQEAPRPERVKKARPEPPPVPQQESKPAPAPVPAPVPQEDPGELCADEKAQKITEFLTGLLEHMESEAQVKVYRPEEGRYKVILEGEKLGQLIGRRGETLDAIQQLTSYCVNRSGEKRVRVHVDAENYRAKREQSLQNLARKVAAKVVRNRRNVTLEPMNAYERHVIHTALQEAEGVTTYSMGTEPNRRVIVAYDRSSKEQKK
ncbi:MAG: Jag N-terminal domain-containing protein [Oscillospiraceae bacterium]|nr:Jag N-terminal domain-containing protein [Oscillospiraceae bacterium]